MIQCYTELHIKHTLTVDNAASVTSTYITKQLEYITKDYIAMYTILFMLKMALFFS